MKIIYNPVFLEHNTQCQPENRKRLELFGNLPITEVPDGKILGEPTEIMGVGWYVSFTDTEGNRMSLLQPTR